MSFKEKYLKYKQKYIQLKNQFGGEITVGDYVKYKHGSFDFPNGGIIQKNDSEDNFIFVNGSTKSRPFTLPNTIIEVINYNLDTAFIHTLSGSKILYKDILGYFVNMSHIDTHPYTYNNKISTGILREYKSTNSNLYYIENGNKYIPLDYNYIESKDYRFINILKYIRLTENEPLNNILKKQIINYDLIKCIDEGYKQHEAECWNDSIQQFFCFSDDLKNEVQLKLNSLNPEEMIQLMKFRNRERFIPIGFNTPEKLELISQYLSKFKDRFIIYYKRNIRGLPLVEIEPSIPKEERRLRRPSFVAAVDSAELGIQIVSPERIEEGRAKNKEIKGANFFEARLLLIILNSILLDDENLLLTKIIYIPKQYYNNTYNINYNYTNEDIDNSCGVLISLDYAKDSSHATSFYTCNKINIYYDDNKSMNRSSSESGIIKFDWKSYMKRLKNENLFPVLGLGQGWDSTNTINKIPCFYNNKTNKFFNLENKPILDIIGIINNFRIIIKTNNIKDYNKSINETLFDYYFYQKKIPIEEIKEYEYIKPDFNEFNDAMLIRSELYRVSLEENLSFIIDDLTFNSTFIKHFIINNNKYQNYLNYQLYFNPILNNPIDDINYIPYRAQYWLLENIYKSLLGMITLQRYIDNYINYIKDIFDDYLRKYPEIFCKKLIYPYLGKYQLRGTSWDREILLEDYLNNRFTLLQHIIIYKNLNYESWSLNYYSNFYNRKDETIKFILTEYIKNGIDIKDLNEKIFFDKDCEYDSKKKLEVEDPLIYNLRELPKDQIHLYMKPQTYDYLIDLLDKAEAKL
jgi:hypothetical protein